tara:strand:+ start:265 stop:576 length:312 start_codon:yes stop_codon:yes gene_type:complete
MSREMELVFLKMVEMGLAPPPKMKGKYFSDDPVLHIRKTLASLSPEERRKSVRKFRKLHRKAFKMLGIENPNKGKSPSVLQKRRRISRVISMIEEEMRNENQG